MEKGKLLLSWEPTGEEDEFSWDDFTWQLTEIIKKKSKSKKWFAEMQNFGWQSRSGHKIIEDLKDGAQLLGEILPKTECTFKIFDFGKSGIIIQNYHHDSPTGSEHYIVVPIRSKYAQKVKLAKALQLKGRE